MRGHKKNQTMMGALFNGKRTREKLSIQRFQEVFHSGALPADLLVRVEKIDQLGLLVMQKNGVQVANSWCEAGDELWKLREWVAAQGAHPAVLAAAFCNVMAILIPPDEQVGFPVPFKLQEKVGKNDVLKMFDDWVVNAILERVDPALSTQMSVSKQTLSKILAARKGKGLILEVPDIDTQSLHPKCGWMASLFFKKGRVLASLMAKPGLIMEALARQQRIARVSRSGLSGTPAGLDSAESGITKLIDEKFDKTLSRMAEEAAMSTDDRRRGDSFGKLVIEMFSILANSSVEITDRSGFAAFLAWRFKLIYCLERTESEAESLSQAFAELMVSFGVKSVKRREKTVVAALLKYKKICAELQQIDEANSADSEENSLRQPAHDSSTTREVPEERTVCVAPNAITDSMSQDDKVSGLTGESQMLDSFKYFLREYITAQVKRWFTSDQHLSLNHIDDIKDSILVEMADRSLQIANPSTWYQFITQEVRTFEARNSEGGTPTGWDLPWILSRVGEVLGADSGKAPRAAQSRRQLQDDPRSPFHRTKAPVQEKPACGNDHVEVYGLSCPSGNAAQVEHSITSVVNGFLVSLHQTASPKPLALITTLAEDLEVARIELSAHLVQLEPFRRFLSKALEAAGPPLSLWHAELIAGFCTAESSDERLEITRILSATASSIFYEAPPDMNANWRGPITRGDGKLDLPQLPRIVFRDLGFSLQAHVTGTKVLATLASIAVNHFKRWKKRTPPLSWSVVDSLVRDFRAHALKHNFAVDEVALFSIGLEERVGAHCPWADEPVRAQFWLYLAEMLRIRPTSAREIKCKLLQFDAVFVDKPLELPGDVSEVDTAE